MSLINVQGGFNPTGAALKLARYYKLNNVAVINTKQNNPYLGKPELQLKEYPNFPVGTSALGTPIYSDLTLKYIDPYTDFLGNVIQPNATDISLETVIITLDQPIRIIKTEIQGRDGTVKEYIGKDDAKIKINAVITGSNGRYPTEKVAAIKAWLDAPVSKSITAWWLDNLGISNIVIEAYSIPQVEGGISYQMFSIDAISDNPVELKITQPNV